MKQIETNKEIKKHRKKERTKEREADQGGDEPAKFAWMLADIERQRHTHRATGPCYLSKEMLMLWMVCMLGTKEWGEEEEEEAEAEEQKKQKKKEKGRRRRRKKRRK